MAGVVKAKGFVTRPWFIGLVAVLIAVELLVRLPVFWEAGPGGLAFRQIVEPALINAPNPSIVLMGNSRFRVGLAPVVVAETLHVPDSEVLNISIDGTLPSDHLFLYKRYRSTISKAEILVLTADAVLFNSSAVPAFGYFREEESLTERAQASGLGAKVDYMAGWAWQTWDKRALLHASLLDALRRQVLRRPSPERDDIGRMLRGSQPATNATAEGSRERKDLRNFDFNESALKAFNELVAMAQSDGLTVVLVNFDLGPVYDEEAELRYAEADRYWRSEVRRVTGLPVHRLRLSYEECGSWEQCFVDDGHLNRQGAELYSAVLGEWLESEQPAAIASVRSALVDVSASR